MTKTFKKTSFYSILLALTLTPLSHAETTNQLNSNAFSDPDHEATMPEGFQETAINYGDKVAADVEVVISLGQQTYPAFHEIVEMIAEQQGIKVDVQQGTCGATAKKLMKKSVDIGTYCCPPGETDRLPGLKFNTIAIAPIALVTNKDNPVSDVTSTDAKKIFKGEYVTWSEVPAYPNLSDKLKGEKIKPIARMHCKKRPGHWRSLMNNADKLSPRAELVGTIADTISLVANNIGAIGYETPFMLKVHKDKGTLKILNIDGKNPEELEHLLAGNYPIYRSYNMTTWTNANNRNEKAETLMDAIYDYVQSHGEEHGFIPAKKLKSAGWKFKDRELIAEPKGHAVISQR
jgi:phosphate transport system substrate-binding protein